MPIPPFLAALRQKVGHDLVLLPTIVVIARNAAGRILLVHDRDAGLWTLPGGIIEPGEAPADAAVREVWEETQVLVTLSHLVGVFGGQGCETTYRNGDRLAWVATVFAAHVGEAVPIPDGTETSEARFGEPEALPAMALRADSLRFLAADRALPSGGHFQAAAWRPD